MRRPHDADCNACVRMTAQEEGDAHEGRDGEHDAEFLREGHAAPAVPHEDHRVAVDACCAQPAVEAAGTACKTVCSKQDKRNGGQDRKSSAKGAESETDEPERCEKNFFEDHKISFPL